MAFKERGIRHRFTKLFRPQTISMFGYFIQSTRRMWTYCFTYQNSSERTAAFDDWNHLYNWHQLIKVSVASLPCPGSLAQEDLLTLHSWRGQWAKKAVPGHGAIRS